MNQVTVCSINCVTETVELGNSACRDYVLTTV